MEGRKKFIALDMEIITKSQEETIELGKKLADHFRGGDILLLNGNLGAGKTTLVKGLAAGLGVKSEITSPTFTLMNIYPANLATIKKLVHIDTYRLKDERDLEEIGVEDYINSPDVFCIIEWPEKISRLLKNKKTTIITIEAQNENKRKIIIE
jgi:tRNA threonylcarbamoyladenosine biosynthesis protein TsaE